MVMCLGQGADLHMAQLMPLPLTISCSSKSRLVLTFWCRLIRVVRDKIQEGIKWLCVCFAELFIKCLNSGDVPSDWKLANVTAIFNKKA